MREWNSFVVKLFRYLCKEYLQLGEFVLVIIRKELLTNKHYFHILAQADGSLI